MSRMPLTQTQLENMVFTMAQTIAEHKQIIAENRCRIIALEDALKEKNKKSTRSVDEVFKVKSPLTGRMISSTGKLFKELMLNPLYIFDEETREFVLVKDEDTVPQVPEEDEAAPRVPEEDEAVTVRLIRKAIKEFIKKTTDLSTMTFRGVKRMISSRLPGIDIEQYSKLVKELIIKRITSFKLEDTVPQAPEDDTVPQAPEVYTIYQAPEDDTVPQALVEDDDPEVYKAPVDDVVSMEDGSDKDQVKIVMKVSKKYSLRLLKYCHDLNAVMLFIDYHPQNDDDFITVAILIPRMYVHALENKLRKNDAGFVYKNIVKVDTKIGEENDTIELVVAVYHDKAKELGILVREANVKIINANKYYSQEDDDLVYMHLQVRMFKLMELLRMINNVRNDVISARFWYFDRIDYYDEQRYDEEKEKCSPKKFLSHIQKSWPSIEKFYADVGGSHASKLNHDHKRDVVSLFSSYEVAFSTHKWYEDRWNNIMGKFQPDEAEINFYRRLDELRVKFWDEKGIYPSYEEVIQQYYHGHFRKLKKDYAAILSDHVKKRRDIERLHQYQATSCRSVVVID